MKKTYSRKQIEEAISYWKKKLNEETAFEPSMASSMKKLDVHSEISRLKYLVLYNTEEWIKPDWGVIGAFLSKEDAQVFIKASVK